MSKEDLDIVNILEKQRKCLNDIETVKKKFGIADHPTVKEGIFEFEASQLEFDDPKKS